MRTAFLLTAILLLAACQSAPEETKDWFDGGDMQPASAETLQLTARVLASKGETTKAGYLINRMLTDFPDYVGTYTEGAEVLLIEGRVNEAIKWIDRGLARMPEQPVLLNNRGVCHLLAADLDQAASDFAQAYRLDPDDAEYVANLALARALQGNEPEATRLWSRVLDSEQVESNLQTARDSRPNFRVGAPQSGQAVAQRGSESIQEAADSGKMGQNDSSSDPDSR
jgi:tetratricopeptide (TPR) repeat protein